MSDDVVIRMEHGWKRYGTTLTREFKHLWQKTDGSPEREGGWTLRDLSFEVHRGEILGVIGRNGAGKSTLLKVLAGVSPLTRGHYELKGRLFTMIELNAGMHLDLTGRQNVHLLGAIMGFTPQEIQRRMVEIEEFCELGEFFDRPVWTYSSGMLARLGFAVAVNVDAEVLLVDEVLAVGDLSFQRKCFARMDALYRSGVSLVFVSHSLRMVERLCARALYMEHGQIISYGPTADVITQYQLDASAELLDQKGTSATLEKSEPDSPSQEQHPVKIIRVELLNVSGQSVQSFETGEAMTIRIHYQSQDEVPEPIVGIGITQETVYITGFSNELQNAGTVLKQGVGVLECKLPRIMLLSGVYSLSLKIRVNDGGILGGGANLIYFSVQTPSELRRAYEYGYVMTDVDWQT